RIFNRSSSAKKNASLVSSACLIPLYCWIFAGLASTTGYAAALRPSTSQYQLNVDSTAIASTSFLNGLRNSSTFCKSHSRRRCAILFPSWSCRPTTRLSLCKSMPHVNLLIEVSFQCFWLLLLFLIERQPFTARRPPRSIALNVYQS